MRRDVLIEGTIILVMSVLGLSESLRLIFHKDPRILYDVLGPGYYILILSLGLMATGVVYVIGNYKKAPPIEEPVNTEMSMKVISSVGVVGLYLFLINIVGYLVATLVFYLLQFKVSGVSKWRTSIILTLVATAAYYIVFIRYFGMEFPRGIIHSSFK